jgi:hypothetical protein
MSSLAALLGRIFNRGTELELQGGLDFKAPLSATVNPTTQRIEITSEESGGGGGGGSGGGMGFSMTYSTTTADADPGAGTLRANNATLSSATALYVDLAAGNGTDITTWLDAFDDYAGSIKGIIRLQSASDDTKWIQYAVTAWTTATGYRKLTVAYHSGPGGLTTDADDTFVSFDYASAGISAADASVTVSAGGAISRAALTGDVTASAGSNSTTIAANAVTTTKIADANVTAAKIENGSACSVLGRGANSSGVMASIASTTVGHVLRVGAGPTVAFGSIDLADSDCVGSSILPIANGGTGTTSVPTGLDPGTALGNADSTISLTTGSWFVLPAGTLSANRVYTIDRNGLPTTTPSTGSLIMVDVLDETDFSKTFTNGGAGGGNPLVVPASHNAQRYWFLDDGTNWIYLGPQLLDA